MGKDQDQSKDQVLLPFDDGSTGRVIRREWHAGRWFFSVVDVVAVLTDSDAPRIYWAQMKQRIQDEGFTQLLARCKQLKMRALDGKQRETDAADVETMLRIVQSIPSPKAEPVRQWLAKMGAQRLEEVAAELNEAQRRLLLRGEVANQNASLLDTAHDAGVVSRRDFAIFQDWGYKGLYGGERARDIAARKGLDKSQVILDWMDSEELAANWFRITQTEAQLRKMQDEGKVTKGQANATHRAVGQEVRAAIERIGGTMPEDLPTPEVSIKELERREQQQIEAELRPSVFPADDEKG